MCIRDRLYSVPEEIRKGYFKVKVLELLLFLSALPTERRRPAYSGAQVRLASAVSEYLLSATEERPTTAELSAKFHASATQILQSFQGVYGMSPAAFLRAQKMHAAAELLRSTDRTVLDLSLIHIYTKNR